jgi:HEPN domain-containing protein
MDIREVKEWFMIADSDIDSAKILNNAVRKHYEIICYHCAQATEKYLKGYLVYQDIEPKKIHDLLFLNKICIEIDSNFESIIVECGFLNRFATNIRYPHRYEITEDDTNFSIKAVEKVRNCKPIIDIINKINE